jgi:hypothetical protein
VNRILRAAVLMVAASGALCLAPVLTAAVRTQPTFVNMTVDVSAYLGRTVHLFGGRAGSLSPYVMANGDRIVVPFAGTVQDLGEVSVTSPRLAVAVDVRLAETNSPRVAVLASKPRSASNSSRRGGRVPVARMVATIDQEPAPN